MGTTKETSLKRYPAMFTNCQYIETGARRGGYTVGSNVQRDSRAKPGMGPCTVSTNPLWIMVTWETDVEKQAGGDNTNIDNFVCFVKTSNKIEIMMLQNCTLVDG